MAMEKVQKRMFPTHTGLLLCALINSSKEPSETCTALYYRLYGIINGRLVTWTKPGNGFVAIDVQSNCKIYLWEDCSSKICSLITKQDNYEID